MNEAVAPVEAENTTEQITTDPWGGEMSNADAALLNENPEQETNDESDDGEEVRQQSEARDETEKETVGENPDEQKDEKTVPYGAMHEERMRRKEAIAEAQELRNKMARMEERFQMFQEAMTPKEPEITFDDDPAEYLRKQAEKTNMTLEQLQKQQQEQAQRQQQAMQNQRFLEHYQAAAREYSEQNPDFHDAYNHLVNGRVKEHMIAGGMSEQQAIALAQREEQAIAARAFEQGENPAEKLVELARLRGWTKQEHSVKVDKVAQVEKGQKASKTISKGGASEGELTLESLAEMEGEEFDKAWSKLFG